MIQNSAAGTPSYAQPFLNDTAESLPASGKIRAATSVVAINTLWMVSLVLSLAAALFGILAKQWCREYLRWHSVNAPARENVLLRQARFEAWERWGVASYIAAVPALLEVALILFLAGLIVFVPTFAERTFTVVAVVAIASVLIGVVILTVLPVFYQFCPFQSPTGWAFIRLASLFRRRLRSLSIHVADICHWLAGLTDSTGLSTLSAYLEGLAGKQLSKMGTLVDWRAYNLRALTESAVCSRASRGLNLEQASEDMSASDEHPSKLDFDFACVDKEQTRLLIRALSWVRRGLSNDETTCTAVLECAPSVHASYRTPVPGVSPKSPHFLSSVVAISCADPLSVRAMARAFFYDIAGEYLSFRVAHFRLPDLYGPFIETFENEELTRTFLPLCQAWESDSISLEICHTVMSSDLLSLVDDWIHRAEDVNDHHRRTAAEGIALFLCLPRIVPTKDVRHAVRNTGPGLTLRWAETLQEVYRRLASHGAAYSNGLVSMCVCLARFLGPVSFDYIGGERRMSSTSCVHCAADHESLIVPW